MAEWYRGRESRSPLMKSLLRKVEVEEKEREKGKGQREKGKGKREKGKGKRIMIIMRKYPSRRQGQALEGL